MTTSDNAGVPLPFNGLRVFRCGCVQRRPQDAVRKTVNGSGWRTVCAVHGETVEYVLITCKRCGKEERVETRQSRRTTCNECLEKMRNRPKKGYKPKTVHDLLTEEQKQYIADHHYLLPSEIARKCGAKLTRVQKYLNDIGVTYGGNPERSKEAIVGRFIDRAVARMYAGDL